MRVAIPLFPTAAFPLLVASDKGFFQREGLTVEPISINSAPTTYQALISGDIQAASGAPTGLLPSHAQGADVVVLGSGQEIRQSVCRRHALSGRQPGRYYAAFDAIVK